MCFLNRRILTAKLGETKSVTGFCAELSDGAEECEKEGRASLSLQVAELHVILTTFLLSKQGAEGIELGFGGIALASDVHLIVAAVDQVRSDGSGEPLFVWRGRHEAQADVAFQRVAVGAAGGRSGQLTVAVDGLSPPRP